jgi:2-methylcitrate dehydratase PrpD
VDATSLFAKSFVDTTKDGALTKRLGPGFAVRGGVMAALMAERGVTGAKNSLEEIVGLLVR